MSSWDIEAMFDCVNGCFNTVAAGGREECIANCIKGGWHNEQTRQIGPVKVCTPTLGHRADCLLICVVGCAGLAALVAAEIITTISIPGIGEIAIPEELAGLEAVEYCRGHCMSICYCLFNKQ